MSATVLFNSLDHTLVSRDWVVSSDAMISRADTRFVDCAGLPFCGDQVEIPRVVSRYAQTVHASSILVFSLPLGPASATGVFETAVAWLSRKEICHIMRQKRVIVQMGMDGKGPTEWPTDLLRDLTYLGVCVEVRTACATPAPFDTAPQRMNDWVGRIEAGQRATR